MIPTTLELGGKSPNIFFADVAEADDDFFDKAIEGLVMFAFNQGEVCTCPSRALIQESIYDKFMKRALERVAAIKQGNPLDTETMLGAQASKEQLTKILTYLELGKQEGAELLAGGAQAKLPGVNIGRLRPVARTVSGPIWPRVQVRPASRVENSHVVEDSYPRDLFRTSTVTKHARAEGQVTPAR